MRPLTECAIDGLSGTSSSAGGVSGGTSGSRIGGIIVSSPVAMPAPPPPAASTDGIGGGVGTGSGEGVMAAPAITGRVTDANGAPLANAVVVARNLDRGTVFPNRSNGEGVYNISKLPRGRYEVSVEAKGFSKAVNPNVDLEGVQMARLDVQMKPGASNGDRRSHPRRLRAPD